MNHTWSMVAASLLAMSAVAAAEDLVEGFSGLEAAYNKASSAWSLEHREAQKFEQQVDRYESWPGWRFAPQFVELAECEADSDEGFKALVLVLDMGNNVGEFDRELFPHYERAIDLLIEHHKHRDLAPICATVRNSPKSEWFLRSVANDEGSPRKLRAEATFQLARRLAQQLHFAQFGAFESQADAFAKYVFEREKVYLESRFKDQDVDRIKTEAVRYFEEVVAKFPEVDATVDKKKLGKLAERGLFELQNLAIGKAAPEIEGVDLHGDALQLSELRGKVVLLVFWASWCGPCIGDIPHERQLLEMYSDRPFAIVGVNADENLNAARRAAESHAIPWRSFRNRQNESGESITDRWNIQAWPTTYLIDHNGVIRHKYLRRNDLDKPIADLVRAAEAAR